MDEEISVGLGLFQADEGVVHDVGQQRQGRDRPWRSSPGGRDSPHCGQSRASAARAAAPARKPQRRRRMPRFLASMIKLSSSILQAGTRQNRPR